MAKRPKILVLRKTRRIALPTTKLYNKAIIKTKMVGGFSPMGYTKKQIEKGSIEALLFHALFAAVVSVTLLVSDSNIHLATCFIYGYTLTVQPFIIFQVKKRAEKDGEPGAAFLMAMLLGLSGILFIPVCIFQILQIDISSPFLTVVGKTQPLYIFVQVIIARHYIFRRTNK